MQQIIVNKNEAGQRLDKFLAKYMSEAPKSFFYKMMRKKNIVLNSKKCDGSEKLNQGDEIKLFLSDDTINNFTKSAQVSDTFSKIKSVSLDVVYEDEHILLINKPSGMLTQKAGKDDVSLNEYGIKYLLDTKCISENDLKTFKPSVCNRLDRNTSGLVAMGKSLKGLQFLSDIFKNRTVNKYYLCVVHGEIKSKMNIKGYLLKNEKTNKVTISKENSESAQYIETEYEPLSSNGRLTLLKVHLITGRSHQIRAHLASVNHPLIGDFKYGSEKINNIYKNKYKIKDQLLHSYELTFVNCSEEFKYLSGKSVKADIPDLFRKFIDGENLKLQDGSD